VTLFLYLFDGFAFTLSRQ